MHCSVLTLASITRTTLHYDVIEFAIGSWPFTAVWPALARGEILPAGNFCAITKARQSDRASADRDIAGRRGNLAVLLSV